MDEKCLRLVQMARRLSRKRRKTGSWFAGEARIGDRASVLESIPRGVTALTAERGAR
jgi:hypothetical protein